MAELRAAEQRVERVEQVGVAAPVARERGAMVGDLGGIEVGVDVGAAERVDRLLRVADEDERRVARRNARRRIVPLDGVGVLELVDEHDVVARAQPRARRRRRRVGRACRRAG